MRGRAGRVKQLRRLLVIQAKTRRAGCPSGNHFGVAKMIAARGTGVLAVAGFFILSMFTAFGVTPTRADEKVTIVLPTNAPAASSTQPVRATRAARPLRVLFIG